MKNKKIKYGKINLNADEFRDENALIRISTMIPMNLYKDLKKLSLSDEYSGKYQVLIRDVLSAFVEKNEGKRKKTTA